MAWTNKASYFSFLIIAVVFIGCTVSYSFTGGSIDYSKVKTIAIADFPIKSDYVYAPLGTRFNEDLKDIFVRQTKLQQISANADLELEGEIVEYRQYNEAVAADGFSSKVRLVVGVNVRYTNNTNHEEDFEQKFSAYRTYESNRQLVEVQDELIAEMVKEICDQIFNATVANW